MKELQAVLDKLSAEARVGEADWADVLARSRHAPAGRRSRSKLVLAVAAVVALGLVGAAIAAGLNALTQQEQFHERIPDDPGRRGPSAQVASGENWALVAWNSDAGLCLDFVVVDNSTFSCGLSVRGDKQSGNDETDRNEPRQHVVAGFLSGGNLVGSDGKATIFGVASPEVARVVVELADRQLVVPRIYDAPAVLSTNVRFFIIRLALGDLERGLERETPVRAYIAYDSKGQTIERVQG